MTKRTAIVVVLDRLGAAYLGPYGNTWIETPAFNQLADASRMWETALANSPSLEATYRTYWSGIPAICGHDMGPPTADQKWLPARLAAAGIPATLITDCSTLAESEPAGHFAEQLLLPSELPSQLPDNVVETQIGQLVGAAVDWIAKTDYSALLWLHAEAMNGIWDAPFALREQFAEEEDPAPSDCLLPPKVDFGSSCDPDKLLSLTHAYAGQVCTIDSCLAALLTAIAGLPAADQPLVIVTSSRGFPLGERTRVGELGDDLYAEVLQVPLFVRMPDEQGARQRIPQIAETADLYWTLLDFFEVGMPSDTAWGHSLLIEPGAAAAPSADYSCAVHGEHVSLRTPIWFLRDGPVPELFLKPDDRCEVNEISSRAEDVVQALQAVLAQSLAAAKANDPRLLPTLAMELVSEQG